MQNQIMLRMASNKYKVLIASYKLQYIISSSVIIITPESMFQHDDTGPRERKNTIKVI
jgi:hypothetical protein